MVINTHYLAYHLSDAGDREVESMVTRLLARGAKWYAPGGGDISPLLYRSPNLYSGPSNVRVDLTEAFIMELVLKQMDNFDTKMLAICRGHQLLGVVLGVKLIQDIFIQLRKEHSHQQVSVKVKEIADLFGGFTIPANSLHHQALAKVPDGWQLSAEWDGVIEGIYHPGLPIISVQWHPEMIPTQKKVLDQWLGSTF